MTETKPSPTCKGLTFFPVPEFDDLTVAFGAEDKHYFNRRDRPEVPRKFEDLVQSIFFSGGAIPELSAQVDPVKAKRALSAWLRSFAPPHESKITTAAYALWVWTTLDDE